MDQTVEEEDFNTTMMQIVEEEFDSINVNADEEYRSNNLSIYVEQIIPDEEYRSNDQSASR